MFLSGADTWVQFFTVLLIFILVLALTYFVTRFIAGYQKGQLAGKHNMEVIDTFKIAQTKYIQIVRIADKYLAIGVCKDTMTVLTELDKDQIHMTEEGVSTLSFKDLLEKVKNKKQ